MPSRYIRSVISGPEQQAAFQAGSLLIGTSERVGVLRVTKIYINVVRPLQ